MGGAQREKWEGRRGVRGGGGLKRCSPGGCRNALRAGCLRLRGGGKGSVLWPADWAWRSGGGHLTPSVLPVAAAGWGRLLTAPALRWCVLMWLRWFGGGDVAGYRRRRDDGGMGGTAGGLFILRVGVRWRLALALGGRALRWATAGGRSRVTDPDARRRPSLFSLIFSASPPPVFFLLFSLVCFLRPSPTSARGREGGTQFPRGGQ